jgi:small subunit ribosomal protein S5
MSLRIGHSKSKARHKREIDGLELFTFTEPVSARGIALRTCSRQTVQAAFAVPGVVELLDWSHLGTFKFKTITRRRVAKMTRAKARMRWNVIVAVGNGDGLFGLGGSTCKQMRDAYVGACKDALLNMTFSSFVLRDMRESRHAKVNATHIEILPRAKGTGLVAGTSLTTMAELVGLKDVSIKIRYSTNPLNVAKSFYEAVRG